MEIRNWGSDMAYMLQPHNYTQIVRPNLYNVAYKRTGAYKGMGRMGARLRGLGQSDVAVTDLPVGNAPYIQANYPSVATYDLAAAASPYTTGINWTYIAIGGVAILALLALAKR